MSYSQSELDVSGEQYSSEEMPSSQIQRREEDNGRGQEDPSSWERQLEDSNRLEGESSIVEGHSSISSGHSSIVEGHSSISSGHSSIVEGHSSISSGHSAMQRQIKANQHQINWWELRVEQPIYCESEGRQHASQIRQFQSEKAHYARDESMKRMENEQKQAKSQKKRIKLQFDARGPERLSSANLPGRSEHKSSGPKQEPGQSDPAEEKNTYDRDIRTGRLLDKEDLTPNSKSPLPPRFFIIDPNLTSSQKKLLIRGQDVYFPYTPYPVQTVYMEHVLQALQTNKQALLQSPTGTGKTLCLLSAVLSWAESEYTRTQRKTKIIYLSRTHSQLQQVTNELKKTCFRPTISTFGSRETLCINSQLKELKGSDKVEACKAARSNFRNRKQRQFYQSDYFCQKIVEKDKIEHISRFALNNRILDIEDMKSEGQLHGFCPYFYPNFADSTLIFMPYNYLLDASLMARYQNLVQGAVLIFDEAHNLSEASCSGRSLRITQKTLEVALREVFRISNGPISEVVYTERQNNYMPLESLINYFAKMKTDFWKFVCKFEMERPNQQQHIFHPDQNTAVKVFTREETVDACTQLFLPINISQQQRSLNYSATQIAIKTKSCIRILDDISGSCNAVLKAFQGTDAVITNIQLISLFTSKMLDLLRKNQQTSEHGTQQEWIDNEINHFRLFLKKTHLKDFIQSLRKNRQQTTFTPNESRVVQNIHFEAELVCLVPWLSFLDILKYAPRSVILSSGTLNPLDSWEKQLGIPFEIRLINKHVIEQKQVALRIVKAGSKIKFDFSFKNLQQNRDEQLNDLARTIIKLVDKIPGGVILIFPSRRILTQFQLILGGSGSRLWQMLAKKKKIIVQAKDSEHYVQDFREHATRGAVLLCVCRGKVSEGIDFPDDMCRAVIFVGIPYPNLGDPYIVEKKEHFDQIVKMSLVNNYLSGSQWYSQNTMRAVSQGLGRVIRHQRDYGVLFLFDSRFSWKQNKDALPKWTVGSQQMWVQVGQKQIHEIDMFFREMNIQTSPKKEKKVLDLGLQNAFTILMTQKKEPIRNKHK